MIVCVLCADGATDNQRVAFTYLGDVLGGCAHNACSVNKSYGGTFGDIMAQCGYSATLRGRAMLWLLQRAYSVYRRVLYHCLWVLMVIKSGKVFSDLPVRVILEIVRVLGETDVL